MSFTPSTTKELEESSPSAAEEKSLNEALAVGDVEHDGGTDDLEKQRTGRDNQPNETASKQMVTAQDWNGPDDPENPQNWSHLKRAMHVFPVAFISFAVTCGSSMITPATPEIERHFHVSQTAAILSLSLFVLGLAIGPTIAAPISEKFGRSVVYKTTAPVFMLFILGAGFTKSFGGLLVCRFLAGAAGGPVLAVGAGTNADLYPTRDRAVASIMYVCAPFLGPSLGPVIGGFAAQYKGYQWTQWCTIFIALAAYAFILPVRLDPLNIPIADFRQCTDHLRQTQETYKKVILQRRAKRLNIPPPPAPKITGFALIKMLLTITIARPLHMLAVEPIVTLLSLYNAFTFSVLFAFFAAYPYAFETVYGFNTWQYGLTFLGIGIGVVLGVVTGIWIDRTIYLKEWRRVVSEGGTTVRPEYRLLCGMVGSVGVTIGLFWFAWTARRDVHWISPVLAGIPFAWGNLCVFISAALYLIDVYGPLNGASAMAANGLARYGLGAAFPLFTFQMYEKLGIGWATSLLGFVSVAMLPIPWIFFKFGPKIRANSHYDTIKA